MENWAERYLVFCESNVTVLHLERNNPMYQYAVGAIQLESSFAKKHLVDDKLSMRQQ